mmetsp:Transcript_1080/g.2982  ORF Transcript_1080/g.2982 Transcript_1080/m.2982 type:complete len:100 (-) Transcript_1080:45-344(-)
MRLPRLRKQQRPRLRAAEQVTRNVPLACTAGTCRAILLHDPDPPTAPRSASAQWHPRHRTSWCRPRCRPSRHIARCAARAKGNASLTHVKLNTSSIYDI